MVKSELDLYADSRIDLYEKLLQRYSDCEKGHVKPNGELCHHCYRHTKEIKVNEEHPPSYDIHKTKSKSRKKFEPKYSTTQRDSEEESEIENEVRRSKDFLEGIEYLKKEFKTKVKNKFSIKNLLKKLF